MPVAAEAGKRFPENAADAPAVETVRSSIEAAIRDARAPRPNVPGKAWPFRYAARRIAWHVLDHAWEIEDRTEVG